MSLPGYMRLFLPGDEVLALPVYETLGWNARLHEELKLSKEQKKMFCTISDDYQREYSSLIIREMERSPGGQYPKQLSKGTQSRSTTSRSAVAGRSRTCLPLGN